MRKTILPSSQLREDAEAELARRQPNQVRPQHPDVLLHELLIHQIELEMQNETLRSAQLALEESRQRYFDLYEFAPVAYLTLTDKGLIEELNLAAATLLGGVRGRLLHGIFARFVAAEDANRWHLIFRNWLQQHDQQSCELVLQPKDGGRRHVRLDCKPWIDVGEARRVRITLIDITDKVQLTEALLRQEARGAEIARHLINVEEEERRRLALAMHDVVSPNLAAVQINLGIIEADLPPHVANHVTPSLRDMGELIRQTHGSLRDICADLRQSTLDYAGLCASVDEYASRYAERTGVAVDLTGGMAGGRLAADVETLLFRIVQEALTNCAKYAQASRITIELSHDSDHAYLEITDDGIGFDTQELMTGQCRQGLGLLTMAERAELAGGQFRLESYPGAGTRITVEI